MIISLAWRNIWRNRWRSLVIIFSVTIGMLAGTLVLSLYQGMMKGRIFSVIHHETGHIQLHHPAFKNDMDPAFIIRNSDSVVNWLRSNDMVASVSGRSMAGGMLTSPSGTAGVIIQGIIPGDEEKVSGLDEKIIEGNGFNNNKKNALLIGRKLAEKIKVKNGSKVVLTFTDTSAALVSGAFRICGIYRSENSVFDEMNVYVRSEHLGNMLLSHPSLHEISVILKDDGQLDGVISRINRKFPDLFAETWKDLSPETDLMVTSVDYYSLILLGIILLALAFGILNTMLMAVLERSREIGMMMALGTSRLRIFFLILLETFMLALTGLPFGLGIGYLITGYFHSHGLDLSGMGEELLSGFGFSPVIYPEFPAAKIPQIMIMVFVTAILSSLIPAFRALRLRPVDTLKL